MTQMPSTEIAHAWVGPIGLALALLLSSCAGAGVVPTNEAGFLNTSTDPIIGGEDLSTWKTYANQVSVVEVVAERQGAPIADWPERFVDRRITLRVERNLYEAPKADALIAESTEIIISTLGWWEKVDEGTLTPVITNNGVRFEVGQTYLVAFAYDGEWWPVNSDAIVAISEDQKLLLADKYVDREFPLEGDEAVPAAVALASLTIDQAEALISTTDIDPFAADFMDLPLHERIDETTDKREAAE